MDSTGCFEQSNASVYSLILLCNGFIAPTIRVSTQRLKSWKLPNVLAFGLININYNAPDLVLQSGHNNRMATHREEHYSTPTSDSSDVEVCFVRLASASLNAGRILGTKLFDLRLGRCVSHCTAHERGCNRLK